MTKKIVFSIALLLLAQGMAFAAASAKNATELQTTGIKFTPSNNVKVFYFSDTQNYTINSKHKAGDRQYSTSNKTSNIWYTTATAGSEISASTTPTTTTGADAADYGSGWTAQ